MLIRKPIRRNAPRLLLIHNLEIEMPDELGDEFVHLELFFAFVSKPARSRSIEGECQRE
jgi:hypothetical protein